MSFPWIIQGSNIVVVIDNKPYTVSKTHPTFNKVRDAIKAGEWDTVREIIEPKKLLLKYGNGNITIDGDVLKWAGEQFHNSLSKRMVEMLQEGFDITPMANFMSNLMDNPSYRAVEELYSYLEANNHPITPDGHFLAFKRVNKQFLDIHSNTVCNKPAYLMSAEELETYTAGVTTEKGDTTQVIDGKTVVTRARNRVDDEKNRTCSTGLHFCSREYLDSFGAPDDPIIILKINPKDVVSIPTDYGFTKGRCCRYEIISELGVNPDDAFVSPVQEDAVTNTDVTDGYCENQTFTIKGNK